MTDITAIVLTKDSQATLPDTLVSLTFCSEIIIIDSGSVDTTLSIARKYTKKIYKDTSLDFAQKRMLGLEKATEPWILYIDADEIVSPELKKNITSAITQNAFAAYTIQRKNFYLGKNEWPYVENITRLFKKDQLRGWIGSLHESPNVEGQIGAIGGYLYHYTHRNLFSMVEKTNQWSNTESLLRFTTNHPQMTAWRFFRVFLTGFYEYYVKQGGWKVGTVGIIESIYQGFSLFITYAKLWELQENRLKIKD